jgi:hypothetical protein
MHFYIALLSSEVGIILLSIEYVSSLIDHKHCRFRWNGSCQITNPRKAVFY